MSDFDVSIELDRDDAAYRPGERISGTVRIVPPDEGERRRVIFERFWRAYDPEAATFDVAGHTFTETRRNAAPEQGGLVEVDIAGGEAWVMPGRPLELRFDLEAPAEPFSQHGELFDIDWFLRARVDVPVAADPAAERVFELVPGEGARTAPYTVGSPGPGAAPDAAPGAAPDPDGEAPAERPWYGSRFQLGCFLLLEVPLLLGGAWALLDGLGGLAAGGGPAWAQLVVGALATLAGLALFAFAARRYRTFARTGPVELALEPEAVRPGESLVCRVRFHPRRDLTTSWARVSLARRERTRGTGDDDRRTTEEEVFRDEPLESIELPAGEPVDWSFEVPVPEDAPFSFWSHRHEVLWRVDVAFELQGGGGWSERRTVVVRP